MCGIHSIHKQLNSTIALEININDVYYATLLHIWGVHSIHKELNSNITLEININEV